MFPGDVAITEDCQIPIPGGCPVACNSTAKRFRCQFHRESHCFQTKGMTNLVKLKSHHFPSEVVS